MGTEAQIAFYQKRRTDGVCVRCGLKAMTKKDGTTGAYCSTHFRMQQEYQSLRRKVVDEEKPDDGLCSISGERQDPRDPFQPAPKVLPPLPDKCPRCRSMLVHVEIEIYLAYVDGVRCPCCGFVTDRQMLQNKLDAEHGENNGQGSGRPCGHSQRQATF